MSYLITASRSPVGLGPRQLVHAYHVIHGDLALHGVSSVSRGLEMQLDHTSGQPCPCDQLPREPGRQGSGELPGWQDFVHVVTRR